MLLKDCRADEEKGYVEEAPAVYIPTNRMPSLIHLKVVPSNRRDSLKP